MQGVGPETANMTSISLSARIAAGYMKGLVSAASDAGGFFLTDLFNELTMKR